VDKKELVQRYVDGWKENDDEKILGTITPDCVIIESHGPVYRGREEASAWINDWIRKGSLVNRWNITSFYEIPPDKAVFEWMFECTVKGILHAIEGISIVSFKENKIGYMREYRTINKV
jgi:hypothetical protein